MGTSQGSGDRPDTSQLFLVRFWTDRSTNVDGTEGEEGTGFQGKVQHVLSGKAASFNDWPTLMTLLSHMLHPDSVDERSS